MNLNELIDRIVGVRFADMAPNVKQRIADAADPINAGADDLKRVQVLNEAVIACTVFIYSKSAHDHKTYRITCPVPWGRAGWQRWGLRSWDVSLLLAILNVRSANQRHGAALFDYSADSRLWFVDIDRYASLESALDYWKSNPITIKEFQTHANIARQNAAARMQRGRGKG